MRSFEECEWDNFRIKSQFFEDLAQVDGSFREVFFFKFFFFFFFTIILFQIYLFISFIVILDLLYHLQLIYFLCTC